MTGSPTTDARPEVIDPQMYRRVLGQYPTGVCVITAESPEHGKCGIEQRPSRHRCQRHAGQHTDRRDDVRQQVTPLRRERR